MRRGATALLGVASLLLLTGCLDVTATLDMENDGSGRLELEYRLGRELYEMGVFDEESAYVPIPVHREDYERAVAGVDGVELERYQIERSESEVVVRSAVRFADLDALNAYYSPGQERIRLDEAGGGRTLVVDLHPDEAGDLDPQTRSFAEGYLSDYYVTFKISAPGAIESAENVAVGDAKDRAEGRFSLASLFTGAAPRNVSVSW
jgi:hypothetical protein